MRRARRLRSNPMPPSALTLQNIHLAFGVRGGIAAGLDLPTGRRSIVARANGESGELLMRVLTYRLLLAVPALHAAAGGAVYAFSPDWMAHHAAMAGREFDTLEPGLQLVLRSFMRVVAASHLALPGLLFVFVLYGAPRARPSEVLCVAGVTAGFYAAALATVMTAAAASPVSPPTAAVLAALAASAAVFVLALADLFSARR